MGKGLVAAVLAALAVLVASATAFGHGGARGANERPVAERVIKPFVVYGVYTREQRSLLVREGYDIGEAYWPDHVELYGTDAEAKALALRGFRVVARPARADFPPHDSNYHNYDEMLADMFAVARENPSTVEIFTLGDSYDGRKLMGVRISNDTYDNLNEPGVFFVGQHHAREHLTVEVMLSLIHLFAESQDPRIVRLRQTRQIYLVPSLNPDGSEYDIATGSYRYWRKNRQPYGGAYGTDQNRNYTYRWGCCGGSSGNPNSETFRGPSPLSTPEDARMADFMLAHPNVTTGISYHSYGDLVLYPYGYTYEDVPPDMRPVDRQAFVAIAAEIGRTTGYFPQQSSDLYITDGDWNDWMYGALRRYPFTIELSSYGYGFYPPDELIPDAQQRNHEAAIFVAQIASCPLRVVVAVCPNDQGPSTRVRRAYLGVPD